MSDSPANVSVPAYGPKGIGGWLILMSIGQVLGPIQLLTGMISEYSGLPDGSFARIPLAFTGEVLLRLGLIGFLIHVAFLFFNKRREFPRMFLISAGLALAQPFVLAAWVTATTGFNTFQNLGSGDFLRPYFFALVVTGAWVAYVLNSVRVKNTFVE